MGYRQKKTVTTKEQNTRSLKKNPQNKTETRGAVTLQYITAYTADAAEIVHQHIRQTTQKVKTLTSAS